MPDAAGYKAPLCPRFQVIRREFGHWDIWDDNGRIFAIRGGPGGYYLRDERNIRMEQKTGPARQWPTFKTLGLLMAYVCEELMYENLSVDGLEPHAIERWNVS
jgi:hypothetical protein